MDKLKMQTANKADENYKKLAEMFPNAVKETIDENGEVVRTIDKDLPFYRVSKQINYICLRIIRKNSSLKL